MPAFPENFHLLHAGEEQFRVQSISAIEASEKFILHTEVIEAAISYSRHCILRDDHRDQDDVTIRLLGVRIANGLGVALNLLLSGYYQASANQQRDLMETTFLLNHFAISPAAVTTWREADEKTLRDKFSPVVIRKALDDHYEQTTRKREEAYKLLCRLAAHPHPQGFLLLRQPNGLHRCGPFFDETALEATLSELGKQACEAGEAIGSFFKSSNREDWEIQYAFYVAKVRWFEAFWKKPIDEAQLQKLRSTIDQM